MTTYAGTPLTYEYLEPRPLVAREVLFGCGHTQDFPYEEDRNDSLKPSLERYEACVRSTALLSQCDTCLEAACTRDMTLLAALMERGLSSSARSNNQMPTERTRDTSYLVQLLERICTLNLQVCDDILDGKYLANCQWSAALSILNNYRPEDALGMLKSVNWSVSAAAARYLLLHDPTTLADEIPHIAHYSGKPETLRKVHLMGHMEDAPLVSVGDDPKKARFAKDLLKDGLDVVRREYLGRYPFQN